MPRKTALISQLFISLGTQTAKKQNDMNTSLMDNTVVDMSYVYQPCIVSSPR